MVKRRFAWLLAAAALAPACDASAPAEPPAAARTGVADAAASRLVVVAAPPAPEAAATAELEEVFPHLDDEPAMGSVSTGDTSHGRLFHGRRLEDGEGG